MDLQIQIWADYAGDVLLPQTAQYALRALVILGRRRSGERVGGAELAEAAHVPRAYLAKVMRRLVVAGLVQARRGRGGGFALRRPAERLRVADVLAAVDVPDERQCAFGWAACRDDRPCPLHPAWKALRERVEEWAGETRLSDLTGAPRRRGGAAS